MKIFLFVILATLLIFLAPSSLYLRYGLYKRFYHDILEWHRPCDEQKLLTVSHFTLVVNIVVKTLCRIARVIGFKKRENIYCLIH